MLLKNPMTGKVEETEREYTVEFLIVRRVTVKALDDCAAERMAFESLTKKDKTAATEMRVVGVYDGWCSIPDDMREGN